MFLWNQLVRSLLARNLTLPVAGKNTSPESITALMACFVRSVMVTSGVVRVPSTSLATATTFASSDGEASASFWSGTFWVLLAVPCSFWIRALLSADASPEEIPRDAQPKAAVGRRWWWYVARWVPLAVVDVTATAAAGRSLKHTSLILSLAMTYSLGGVAKGLPLAAECASQTWYAGHRACSG